jgi:hypothetical protein
MDSIPTTPAETTNLFIKYLTLVGHVIFIFTYAGVGITAPASLTNFEYYLKLFISVFLLYRFNSFRDKIVFEELDRRIAFSAGIFMFSTTVVNEILLVYSTKYRDQIIKKVGGTIAKQQ